MAGKVQKAVTSLFNFNEFPYFGEKRRIATLQLAADDGRVEKSAKERGQGKGLKDVN